jgi:hypothetical protein
VTTELNTENRSKSKIFHVEIIYTLIITFAIFDGNPKHSGRQDQPPYPGDTKRHLTNP